MATRNIDYDISDAEVQLEDTVYKKSKIKIAVVLLVAILLSAALIILSFFAYERYSFQIQSVKFWIDKFILAAVTFIIAICIAIVTEESTRAKDKDFIDRTQAVNHNYATVTSEGLTDELDLFLHNLNRQSKYRKYLKTLKRKYSHTRNVERKLKLREQFFITPDELYESAINVKYNRLSYTSLVSGSTDIRERRDDEDSDNDVHSHKLARSMKSLVLKLVIVILLGSAAGDLVYSVIDFNSTMIVPLLFKIGSICLAVVSGMSLGHWFVTDDKITIKRKLRIYSKFFKRQKQVYDTPVSIEQRYAVVIKPDPFVEKLKFEMANQETCKLPVTVTGTIEAVTVENS